MKKFLYVLLFSIALSCCILNAVADDINKKLPATELIIKSGKSDVIYFTSDGNLLNVNLTFINNGTFNIYLIENESIISEDPLSYESAVFRMSNVSGFIDKKIEFVLMIVDNTEYQIIIENIGSDKLNVRVDIENSHIMNGRFGLGNSPWLFSIVLVIVLGTVLVFSMMYSHKNRILVYQEKKDLNHTLEKVIDVYKNDPDKVLDIIKEMSESVSEEGHRLTDVFTTITDRVSDRLGRC